MKKISLTICCGTYCHVYGGAELQLLQDGLPDELRDYVEVRFSTCLEYCKENPGKPPFVEINGAPMASANTEKVITELRNMLKKEKDGSKQ